MEFYAFLNLISLYLYLVLGSNERILPKMQSTFVIPTIPKVPEVWSFMANVFSLRKIP